MNRILTKMRTLYWRVFASNVSEKPLTEKLKEIDQTILNAQPQDIPRLFEDVPLDVFGKLYLDSSSQYPNIVQFLPPMVSDADQDLWTGTHGWSLLLQSLAFMDSMLPGYQKFTGQDIRNARVLDFGCGWGRLIRLLYKYVPYEQIYGVDPWERSIEICREHNIKAHLAVSDYVPHTLPFDVKFNLIFAFSVFTHLSEKTCHTTLSTLRNYIAENGLLVITIRPRDYWLVHEKGALAPRMQALHDATGFAFTPHNLPPIDGDITYGDTSISFGYFEKNFPHWKIVGVTINAEDPYQTLMFLRPV